MVLRKSFYIRWSAGRSPRVHEVNPGQDPSKLVANTLRNSQWLRTVCEQFAKILFCCFSMLFVLSSTASHSFHFSFVFPLNFGLVDG